MLKLETKYLVIQLLEQLVEELRLRVMINVQQVHIYILELLKDIALMILIHIQ